MGRANHGKPKNGVRKRLFEELELFFMNELADDRLDGVEFTGFELSTDKKHLTVWYLPPEGSEESVADALLGVAPVCEDRATEVLRKRPEIRFRFDRGAGNERRVGAILEDLRARGELPPLEAEPPKGESEDEDPSPRAGP